MTPPELVKRTAGGHTCPASRPSGAAWWLLFLVVLGVVFVWPPSEGRSLALKLTNWAVDPMDTLPTLPPQLGPGLSDDPAAVEARDAVVRRYDELHGRGRWMRARLRLKVARDPFNPTTERQLLLVVVVSVAFLTWRFWSERQA